MKKILTLIMLLISSHYYSFSQGVAIVKIDSSGTSFTSFMLEKSHTTISISNQVATTVTTQVFRNNTADTTNFKYAFPLPEAAGATKIRWLHGNVWRTAVLIGAPQDTTFQNDSSGVTSVIPAALDTFLGKTPLYMPVETEVLPGESISIELSYVELLPYVSNYVSLHYPGRYNLVQTQIDSVSFDISILSYRQIDSLLPSSYSGWNKVIFGNTATASLTLAHSSFDADLSFEYLLHPDSTGFFSFSTFYPNHLNSCDTINGYFTFIMEPNSVGDDDIIGKDFVLIIDHSGSMGGTKMDQANEAAAFIVNNLNSSDRFNIVKFDDVAHSFAPSLQPFSLVTKSQALNYISGIYASGLTNISGSFDLAVPMFAGSGSSRAKIIIFFTDGHPSAGISSESPLISHVTGLIQSVSPDISLYTFGIGPDVNRQLLSQMAAQNRGTSAFLDNHTVASAISNFYLTIQSPVLLGTSITYDPPVVSQTYPNPLPSLFKGHQMIVCGRYTAAGPVKVKVNGTAFGNNVSYEYLMNLVDTLEQTNSFLPKVWAKGKIDHLVNQFYLNETNKPLSDNIKLDIEDISVCYGIVSPFTSFSMNNPGGGGTTMAIEETASVNSSLYIYPNPASNYSMVKLPAGYRVNDKVMLSIVSAQGRVVAVYEADVLQDNNLVIDINKLGLAKGTYIIEVQIGDSILRGKLLVM